MQESDADGKVTFKTIFPAAYAGRWPHIHFEVYESLDAATGAGQKLRTSQLAIPQEACEAVYATDGYEQSVQNLCQTSLDTDMVFSDGYASQLASVSGSVDGRLHAHAQRRRLTISCGRGSTRDAGSRPSSSALKPASRALTL